MRVECTATSLSWIPSEAVTGLTKGAFAMGLAHYDEPPPGTLTDLEELRLADRFRFANRLRVWAEFADGRLTGYGQDGGSMMGSTTVRLASLGATFAGVGMPDLRPEPEIGDGWVRFAQTCGGRTALPAPRPIRRPPYVRLQSPLVWTTLAITLFADGRSEVTLAGASPFPRHWVYGPAGELSLKAGVTDFASWMGQLSHRHTPWGDEDSPVLVTAAETALERELSSRLMKHGTKPTIRRLAAGTVLAEQGRVGDSLYLLLDGVLSVAVDGEPLGELGPGAVLGERAVLEGGMRTATLTAVTPVRVAEAGSEAIDLDALAELSRGHRREEMRAGTPQSG
jgi:hypothetical protein